MLVAISPLSAFLLSAFSFSLLLAFVGYHCAHIDLTAGTNLFSVDRTYTWNLGATGMRGWIYHNWPVTTPLDGYTEFAPYQILVTAIGTNTPASGIMASNDVILGVSAGASDVPALHQ